MIPSRPIRTSPRLRSLGNGNVITLHPVASADHHMHNGNLTMQSVVASPYFDVIACRVVDDGCSVVDFKLFNCTNVGRSAVRTYQPWEGVSIPSATTRAICSLIGLRCSLIVIATVDCRYVLYWCITFIQSFWFWVFIPHFARVICSSLPLFLSDPHPFPSQPVSYSLCCPYTCYLVALGLPPDPREWGAKG